jgi:hypothetical protein
VSRIAHGGLALYNPLSTTDLDEAIALLDLAPAASVLDVACGPAEVLRRIADRWLRRRRRADRARSAP